MKFDVFEEFGFFTQKWEFQQGHCFACVAINISTTQHTIIPLVSYYKLLAQDIGFWMRDKQEEEIVGNKQSVDCWKNMK